MTRRITLGILGSVVVALVLVGVGTLVIGTARAKDSTEAELRRQATELADSLVSAGRVGTAPETPAERRALANELRVLNAARRLFDVDGIDILVYRDFATEQSAPDGVDLGRLDLRALARGEVQSGSDGRLVYAAAATVTGRPGQFLLVVMTRRAGVAFGDTLGWFVVASVAVIALGSLVAWWLGRQLAHPVAAAGAAAQRIAAGDLAVRLPEPPAKRRDELSELSRSVNTMAAELQRSRDLEQQFLLSVSHDLRTPLTSIRGYADAIADGVGDPAHSAEVIRTESRRLERLVGDLLDLSRLRAGSFSLHPVRTDLGALAAAAVEGFLPDAADRGLALTTEVAGPMPVEVDRDRMAQVIGNLVQNALKYARSRVAVGGVAQGQEATLWVDDDGPGIAPQDLPHVFERLYVATHRPVRAESSSGLGLAITKDLVEAMGGTVAAGIAPTGGARIVVRLPLRA